MDITPFLPSVQRVRKNPNKVCHWAPFFAPWLCGRLCIRRGDSLTTLEAKAGKRKHQLLRRFVSLPWRHWIEAVRLDLGPGLPVRKVCGRQSAGGWRAREHQARAAGPARGRGAFAHRGCCLSRRVRTAESASAVFPGDRPCSSDEGGPAGGGGRGAGPARALSAVRPTRGRVVRPPERAAGPSVRAAGAYWSAGRRGRGPGRSPDGQRPLLFQEDLEALSPRRPQQRVKELPRIFKEAVQ